MTPRLRIAFGIYLVLALAGAAWGIGFLLRTEFTPYHGAAAGVPWSQVPPNFQVVILALTKLAGGLWTSFALAILVLLWFPFRRGAPWAIRAVPLLLVAHYLAPMPAMWHLSANSASSPPWGLTFASIAIALSALALSIPSRGSRPG